MGNFARPLIDTATVENFLTNCLGIEDDCQWLTDRDAEATNSVVGQMTTLADKANRQRKYRDEDARKALRKTILTELIELDRLDNDDDIRLGTGGAKPKGAEPVAGHNAYFIVGLPASGKSTLVTRTADLLGAMIIDSDFAKRKLPEFENTLAGANLVHKESSLIVIGDGGVASLLGYCKTKGLNVVIPTVGGSMDDVIVDAQALKDVGYNVHLSATILGRDEAAKRAASRFLETERYVPLSLIFDGYANDPVMHYYQQRCEHTTVPFWDSLGSCKTGGAQAGALEYTGPTNPVFLLEEDAK
jgi:hypothetical protein